MTTRIYCRDTIAALAPTQDKSMQYSRKQARDIFARCPGIAVVEYVPTGNKTDSAYVGTRGTTTSPAGVHVIICSTGGKWGKSRREYRPMN